MQKLNTNKGNSEETLEMQIQAIYEEIELLHKSKVVTDRKLEEVRELIAENKGKARSASFIEKELEEIKKRADRLKESANTITLKMLNEITSYNHPPQLIILTTEAILFVLTGKKLSWSDIRKEMAKNFISRVTNMDWSKISKNTLETLKKDYFMNPSWSIDRIKKSSVIAGILAEWMIIQARAAEIELESHNYQAELEVLREERERLLGEEENLEIETEAFIVKEKALREKVEELKKKESNGAKPSLGSGRGGRPSLGSGRGRMPLGQFINTDTSDVTTTERYSIQKGLPIVKAKEPHKQIQSDRRRLGEDRTLVNEFSYTYSGSDEKQDYNIFKMERSIQKQFSFNQPKIDNNIEFGVQADLKNNTLKTIEQTGNFMKKSFSEHINTRSKSPRVIGKGGQYIKEKVIEEDKEHVIDSTFHFSRNKSNSHKKLEMSDVYKFTLSKMTDSFKNQPKSSKMGSRVERYDSNKDAFNAMGLQTSSKKFNKSDSNIVKEDELIRDTQTIEELNVIEETVEEENAKDKEEPINDKEKQDKDKDSGISKNPYTIQVNLLKDTKEGPQQNQVRIKQETTIQTSIKKGSNTKTISSTEQEILDAQSRKIDSFDINTLIPNVNFSLLKKEITVIKEEEQSQTNEKQDSFTVIEDINDNTYEKDEKIKEVKSLALIQENQYESEGKDSFRKIDNTFYLIRNEEGENVYRYLEDIDKL